MKKTGEKKRIKIEVNPKFVEQKIAKLKQAITDGNKYNIETSNAFAGSKMWVQLIEKALAQLEGSYSEIEGSNFGMNLYGIELLTGKKNNFLYTTC